ncbi:hypothetical protein OSTOST_00829, partial [Ostertagia ostertagi]
TDALWRTAEPSELLLKSDEIAAFCFNGDRKQALTHGIYELDEENMVKSLSYRCHSSKERPAVVLALLFLPPSVSTRFLSLYSVYPISRCTYYGVDSGTLGLKLSLFFDVIMATCLPEAEFASNHLETNKSDRNFDLLKQARREVWKRFHLRKCRAYCLPLAHYEYLGEIPNSDIILSKREVVAHLQKSILSRISAMILNGSQDYSTALLKTLLAINYNFVDVHIDILAELESLCSQSVPHCARALMLTAEYLAIRARGRGGLRSGPAANPAFTRIFDLMR